MSGQNDNTVALHDTAQAALRESFIGWQCRLRRMSVREAGGKPEPGMRPQVTVEGEDAPLGYITVLLVREDPEDITAEFRHVVRKSNDPRQRRESGLKLLQATYYQYPGEFTDQLAALFGPDSAAAEKLLMAGRAHLAFEQYNQTYAFPCRVMSAQASDPRHQAAFWHNRLFNPNLPKEVRVLIFTPEWRYAQADPPVPMG
jgi:hypothetical protein